MAASSAHPVNKSCGHVAKTIWKFPKMIVVIRTVLQKVILSSVRCGSPQICTLGILIKKLHIKKFRGWLPVTKRNFLTRGENWKSTSQNTIYYFLFGQLLLKRPGDHF